MKITKMSGAGNTFLIINAIKKWNIKEQNLSDLAVSLCAKYNTDGLVVLKDNYKVDFEWEFINMDGSHANMCGNAARCAIMYAFRSLSASKTVYFQTKDEIISGEILDSKTVRIFMGSPSVIDSLTVCGKKGLLIDSGVLHFVVNVEDIDVEGINDPNLTNIARDIQNTPGPTKNVNITFYCSKKRNRTHDVKTFERGVFKFTKACGTGAVAVATALIFQNDYPFIDTIYLLFEGGTLEVSVLENYSNALLSGNAETLDVFEEELDF